MRKNNFVKQLFSGHQACPRTIYFEIKPANKLFLLQKSQPESPRGYEFVAIYITIKILKQSLPPSDLNGFV